MAAPCFIAWNANTSALTAPMAGQATSATSGTVRTMLQIASPTSSKIRIIEWGYIFTTTPTAPVQMELITTGTVFATSLTAGSIANYNDATGPASLCTTGASATGYNTGIGAEGTITATRLLAQTFDNATWFKQQFPLGREPEVAAGYSLRVRATPTTSSATTVLCYVAWEE